MLLNLLRDLLEYLLKNKRELKGGLDKELYNLLNKWKKMFLTRFNKNNLKLI